MKTKIVYIITSSGKDLYVEQGLMSIWSCKYFNPEANITIVADSDTKPYLEKYTEFKELVSEFIYKVFENNCSNAIRSRILKTTLRDIIKGDFLFVDTDTIFCNSVAEIDNFNYDVALVGDLHAKNLESSPMKEDIIDKFKKIYKQDTAIQSNYFNSGVIFVKDTAKAHSVYKEWHNNWLVAQRNGQHYDQIPLLKVSNDHPDWINFIPDEYNVQCLVTIKYLYMGKILHFFNFLSKEDGILSHPFYNKKYYDKIKINKKIPESIKDDILNVKSLFHQNTFVVGPEEISFWISQQIRIIKKVNKKPFLKSLLNLILKIMYKFTDK